MASYFIDTEFIEGFKKPIKWLPTIGNFNKPYHSIQLISIGIVCSDGREYYAISNEFNPNDANDWVRDNVLSKLPPMIDLQDFNDGTWMDSELKISSIPNPLYKSNKAIAWGILRFIHQPVIEKYDDGFAFSDEIIKDAFTQCGEPNHEFYGYYCDYDWVLLCSLFGTMADLPKGFPMYAIDLKQAFDEYCKGHDDYFGDLDFGVRKDVLKAHHNYPKQTNEHNALADAKWNFELYKFLNTL